MLKTPITGIKRTSFGALALSCSFLLMSSNALAFNSPSDLDSSLAGRGATLLEYRHSGLDPDSFRSWNHPTFAAHVNNDGSFTIVGTTEIACDDCGAFSTERKMVIIRFAADGSYVGEGVTDSSFLYAATFSRDGNKVFGVGEASYLNGVLRKFNLDGSLDTSFGEGGSYDDVDNRLPLTPALFIDNENRLLVGYHHEKGLSRFLPNGTLDTSFGIDGSTGPDIDRNGADIVQTEDGHYYVMTSGRFVLKYDNNGQLVSSFG